MILMKQNFNPILVLFKRTSSNSDSQSDRFQSYISLIQAKGKSTSYD